MSNKLWIAHETSAKTFGPTRVSIEGCEYVDDFLEEIKKKFALSVPSSHLTLYTSDGITEIDVGDSPSLLLNGNSRRNPLIVRSIHIEIGILIYEVQISEEVAIDSPKRRKVDDLIENSKKYLLKTERWGCVTVIKKRRAVTFAHAEHSTVKRNERMKIYSVEGNVEYDVKVVNINTLSDWILLESDVDLCEKEPIWGPVVDGHRYVQLGLSATHQNVSPFAISTGVVSSERPNWVGHTLGSSGSNPGDSGGGCFDESSCCLVGINVGCENISVDPDKDTVRQTYNKISSRYASRAHIIPVNSFQFV